jgi:hypothetical protein
MCGGLSHSVLSYFSHFRSLVSIGILDEFSPLISVLCVHSPCYLVFRGIFSLECSQLNVGLHSFILPSGWGRAIFFKVRYVLSLLDVPAISFLLLNHCHCVRLFL